MASPDSSQPVDAGELDMIVVGAGLAGINTGYYIQNYAGRKTSYTILEGRAHLGGTWDLFKYPGIRCDSDIYTFGFSWNPFKGTRPLVQAPEILDYFAQSAAMAGVDKHIQLNHRVTDAAWSSKTNRWTLTVTADGDKVKVYRARFVVFCTGYYDYEKPFQTTVPGIENFQGQIIQPQFWPEDLDYTDKNMVIIGSGATAVTVLPSVAPKVKHVTMLQRSPTFMFPFPMTTPWLLRLCLRFLPRTLGAIVTRWTYILWHYINYYACRFFPRITKKWLVGLAAQRLPPNVPVRPHFTPSYNPWDQRICAVPEGDFFKPIRSGKASVVTDTIATVTEKEIKLASGQTLQPDIIVLATGIKLQFGGGIPISVDGSRVYAGDKYAWRGCMVQDVPNFAFVAGYANASWTLGAEAASVVFMRLWNLMDKRDINSATPRLPLGGDKMPRRPFFGLTSTYLQNATQVFPNSGEGQWQLNYNYVVDITRATWGDIQGVMEFH
jgi:cation diffusion facilitator CzcD-associated flavoprotein CzcO